MKSATLSIVHYQQPDLLRRCLLQFQRIEIPSCWKIIVVENSPFQEGAAIVQKEFPHIPLLGNGRNNGFGGGHNLAFSASDDDYFFVLNPDILVLDNSLQVLVNHLDEHPEVAVVGPCLLNPDGSMQYSARRFYDWKTVFARRLPWINREAVEIQHLMKDADLSVAQSVNWLLGAALAVRRTAFPDGHLFDPRYQLYFEDVDLCYFIQKKGWQVHYCPLSKMIHDHQRASAKGLNKKVLIHFTSWLKFWAKTKLHKETSSVPSNPKSFESI